MLKHAGFIVQYSYEIDADGRSIPNAMPPGPAWLRKRLGIEYFDDIVSVSRAFMVGKKLSDQDFDCLRYLSKMRSLTIPDSRITDAGCLNLDTLPALEDVNLSSSSISDAGLAHLTHCRQLRSLILVKTQIHGQGFAGISSNSKLVYLLLDDTPFNDSGMEHLAELSSLRELSLDRTKITDRGMASFASLPLETLCINETRVTGAGLAHLRGHRTLERLLLDGTNVADDGVAHLATMPRLNTLWLRNDHITEACFADLIKCQSLTGLVIDENFSPVAVERLRKGLPNCEITELSSGK